jgi:PKD repeat protein
MAGKADPVRVQSSAGRRWTIDGRGAAAVGGRRDPRRLRTLVLVLAGLSLAAASVPLATGGEGGAAAPGGEGAPTTSLFTYLGTAQLTPDGNFLGGGFVRIYDSPTADRVLVTFNTSLDHPEGDCVDSAHVYAELTTDLGETGNTGTIACLGGDVGSLLLGDTYYLVAMHREGDQIGWLMSSYQAGSWEPVLEHFHVLDYPREADNDPMVAPVNGQIDISSQYNASGSPPPLEVGAATFHLFFTPDLQFLEKRILEDTPSICGSSMVFVDGVYYFVTADAFFGNVVVITYDQDWNYLGVKTLLSNGHFSEGLVFDGRRFYVAYMDTSMRTPPNSLPVNLNVRLAAFDRNWDLLEDIPVTEFEWEDLRQPGRPWLLLRGDRLYVSYDCDTIDPVTHQEQRQGQAYVAWYRVASSCTLTCSGSAPVTASVGDPVAFAGTAETSGCSGSPSWDWDFGDGSAHDSVEDPSHTYPSAGTFTWTMTASVEGAVCSDSGQIVVSGVPEPTARYLVPGVAHLPGAGGSTWRSDLAVVNPGTTDADLTLTLLDHDTGVTTTAHRTLAAGTSEEWVDLLVSVLGLQPSAQVKGLLAVASSEPLAISCRTYNQETVTRTFGQNLPALTAADALAGGADGVVPHVKRNARFRTNLGVVNLGPEEATVEVRLFDASGDQVGSIGSLTLPGGNWRQQNDVLGWVGAGDQEIAYARVTPSPASALVWVYASLVDNATGDPTTVIAVVPSE